MCKRENTRDGKVVLGGSRNSKEEREGQVEQRIRGTFFYRYLPTYTFAVAQQRMTRNQVLAGAIRLVCYQKSSSSRS